MLASTVYILLAQHFKNSNSFFPITLVAVAVAFTFRVLAVRDHWGSIVPFCPPADGTDVVPPVAPPPAR